MILSKTLILVAAYGRNYSDEAELLKDWLEGKDFKFLSGPYCSIRDIEELKTKFHRIIISYDFGRQTYIIK